MVRTVLYLLLAVLLITFLRSILGVLAKLVGAWLEPTGVPGSRRTPTGGELKRDPVCGVYISTAASVKITDAGQVVHFCSTACRDKFRQGPAKSA